MLFDAVIFDFDGTLVDSAGAKREAFFSIFPPTRAHQEIVEAALQEDPDGSRYRVIPRMLERMNAKGLALGDNASSAALINRYGEMSAAAVAAAPELPGASALLANLATRVQLYLCSNSPEATVRNHADARGWTRHFKSVDGHPTTKVSKVASILDHKGFAPDRVAMVGDGVSDEEAASANGCVFLAIRSPADLAAIGRILGACDV
jgi:phosphoglycolate phosphatase